MNRLLAASAADRLKYRPELAAMMRWPGIDGRECLSYDRARRWTTAHAATYAAYA